MISESLLCRLLCKGHCPHSI